MAIVNIDLSEYDSIRSRNSELELRVKQLEEDLKNAKSTSKVIVRTRTRNIWRVSVIYERDKVHEFGEDSESYVNFEDVRLKVEEYFKKEIEKSIKGHQEAASSYRKREAELQEKFDNKYEQCESVNKLRLNREVEANNNLMDKMKSAKNDILDVVKELDSKFVRHTKEIEKLKDIANMLYINI